MQERSAPEDGRTPTGSAVAKVYSPAEVEAGVSWATKPPSNATCSLSVSREERFKVSVVKWFGSDSASGASFQILAV